MAELPNIDPAWTRRRPSPAAKELSLPWILCVAAVAVGVVCFARARAESDLANQAAASRSAALAAEAHRQLAHQLENERVAVHYISEAEADRQIRAAEVAARSGGASRPCAYRGNGFYETGNCSMPVDNAYAPSSYSARGSLAFQAQAQANAEARLRAEEARFAALTNTGGWSPPQPAISGADARARCADAKAERDQAYRLVGNNRTYDFIKHWNDIVFEACKNT